MIEEKMLITWDVILDTMTFLYDIKRLDIPLPEWDRVTLEKLLAAYNDKWDARVRRNNYIEKRGKVSTLEASKS